MARRKPSVVGHAVVPKSLMWRGWVGPAPFTEGQRIVAPLRLRPVTGFRDPGTYDYAAHLAREGIYVAATLRAESVTPLVRARQARVGRGDRARAAAGFGGAARRAPARRLSRTISLATLVRQVQC